MEFIEICKPFSSLSAKELYAILKLRSEIFVVEQKCVYLDADGKDPSCQHLMLYQQKELVAYARIVPAGISFSEPSIGRIVSSDAVRGKGFGKELVRLAIENCIRLYGRQPIKIGAQLYLKKFYESFGFISEGDVYDEDGIDHIHMRRSVI
ncbi:GNAT family N-acetyltransferase [Pedobacter nutrimenti]|uniref:ElaA protein n=1 Tax=Pedobacter nutrimenti TaxID=1241337 RepID=A0A318USP7_9SPHI|nr:GNAT family N-acetyltransferase [Pedobacter nutrimenti]PYF77125.1 ElaA protein [Pedobacter nutrimenti]